MTLKTNVSLIYGIITALWAVLKVCFMSAFLLFLICVVVHAANRIKTGG